MYEDLYYGKSITFDLTEGRMKTNQSYLWRQQHNLE
jgi:hypothetical protein